MSSKGKEQTSLALAEQRALQIIKTAEANRTSLLQEANDAAQDELLKIKKEYQEKHENKKFDLTAEEATLRKETEQDIKKTFSRYEEKKDELTKFLIDRITNVDIVVARNLIGDFSSLQVNL